MPSVRSNDQLESSELVATVFNWKNDLLELPVARELSLVLEVNALEVVLLFSGRDEQLPLVGTTLDVVVAGLDAKSSEDLPSLVANFDGDALLHLASILNHHP